MSTPVIPADPISLPIDQTTRQICPKVGGTVLIYNADITNIAYVGYKNGIGVGNSTPIQPLTYVVMSGDRTLYGFCPTASMLLNITPGGTYQSPSPAQIAAQIAIAGIVLLGNPVNLITIPNQVLAGGGGGFLTALVPVSKYLSYDVQFNVLLSAANANITPAVRVTLNWYADALGTIPLYEEIWVIPGSSSATSSTVGVGRAHGSYVSIQLVNLASVQATVNGSIIGSSRLEPLSDWRSASGVDGYNDTQGLVWDDVIARQNVIGVIAPGGNSTQYSLGLFQGDCQLTLRTSGGTAASALFTAEISAMTAVNTITSIYQTSLGPANPLINVRLFLPRNLCIITLTNNDTVNITPSKLSLIGNSQ